MNKNLLLGIVCSILTFWLLFIMFLLLPGGGLELALRMTGVSIIIFLIFMVGILATSHISKFFDGRD